MAAPAWFAIVVSGSITGTVYSPDGTVPAGGVAITQGEFASVGPWSGYSSSGGVTTGTIPARASAAQAAVTLLAGGLTITSTGTPSINGTYAADDATLRQMRWSIDAAGTAPILATHPAKLISGAWIGVGSSANVAAIYGAACMFNYCCNAIINGLPSAPTPSSSATIA